MIKDYRLSRIQRQAKHTAAQPCDVQNSKHWVQCDGKVSIENRAVENEDDGDDLAGPSTEGGWRQTVSKLGQGGKVFPPPELVRSTHEQSIVN